MTRCWRACGREGRGYGLTAANGVRPAALCAAAALWAQAPELAESLWLRRVLDTPMGGALAPPRLTFESCVCTRVCVHTDALTLAQADGIHTNIDLGARAGAGCVRALVWCVRVWVVGVQGGASAPPILNIHPEELLKRLDHRRASQDRATSSVEQPCHEAAQAPAAQTSMSARAQSASACANRSTRLACPPPQHPTCRGVRTGTSYACGMRAVR